MKLVYKGTFQSPKHQNELSIRMRESVNPTSRLFSKISIELTRFEWLKILMCEIFKLTFLRTVKRSPQTSNSNKG